MTPFLIALTQAIYAGRRGALWPQRVELAPGLHERFQREVRCALQEMHIDAVLVGSMAGVPVVQREALGATVVHADGTVIAIPVPICST